jgi:hypothetical protein
MTRSATRPATPTADKTPAKISTGQMRRMHALLRDHGIIGDKAVHDYITADLAENDEPPVEHRNDLTTVQAARIIADLETSEVATAPTAAGLTALREPFGIESVGKLPRSTCRDCSRAERKVCERHTWVTGCSVCRGSHSSATMHIDYVGHADVTARLLAVDPYWTWRPFTPDELAGIPPHLRAAGVWIMLTVLGVTRPGFGDSEGDRKADGQRAKECIGDALRNAAMRFGVALDLWAKGDRDWAHAEKTGTDQHPDEAPPSQDVPTPPYVGPTADELHGIIASYADRAGISVEQITEKWRAAHGGLTMDQYADLPPQALAALERVIGDYITAHPDEFTAVAV